MHDKPLIIQEDRTDHEALPGHMAQSVLHLDFHMAQSVLHLDFLKAQ